MAPRPMKHRSEEQYENLMLAHERAIGKIVIVLEMALCVIAEKAT
jgi:hypothetical protein